MKFKYILAILFFTINLTTSTKAVWIGFNDNEGNNGIIHRSITVELSQNKPSGFPEGNLERTNINNLSEEIRRKIFGNFRLIEIFISGVNVNNIDKTLGALSDNKDNINQRVNVRALDDKGNKYAQEELDKQVERALGRH